MLRFTSVLRTAFGQFGPDEILAPTLAEAILLARAEVTNSLQDTLQFAAQPRGWRLQIRDDANRLIAEVPFFDAS
jgi:hypothetical protein